MPYARRNARKPRRRVRNYRRRAGSRRGATTRRTTNFNSRNMLRPSVYPFVRSFEQMLVLEAPSGNFGNAQNNMVVGTMVVALSNLPNFGEFTTLFQAYKLNAIQLKFTPSYQVDSDPAAGETIICDVWQNPYGNGPGSGFMLSSLLQIQKRQSFIMPSKRSFTRNMRLSQLSNTYGGTNNTDYAKVRPKYMSTAEPHTPHYGLSFCFRRPDGAPMTNMSPRLLINATVKLTAKQVY